VSFIDPSRGDTPRNERPIDARVGTAPPSHLSPPPLPVPSVPAARRSLSTVAGLGAAVCGLITACSGPTPSGPPPPAPPEPSSLGIPGVPALGTRPTPPSAASLPLPPPGPVRNWDQLRLQAAKRMVAANAGETYMGKPPEVLLAIPVLEIELNADGSVRRIVVLRKPGQAADTTQLAIAAVGRAAPYGDVSKLPKPWKFVETFLFDDDRRFKPRSLD
jgi:hypothetical protein